MIRDSVGFARVLGYAGALPFIGLAIAHRLDISVGVAENSFLLYAYGIVILSFLGGMHWGRVASDSDSQIPSALWLCIAVCPSLIGWFSLFFDMPVAITMLIGGFIAFAIIDLRLVAAGIFASWMYELRLVLSLIACASLGSLLL